MGEGPATRKPGDLPPPSLVRRSGTRPSARGRSVAATTGRSGAPAPLSLKAAARRAAGRSHDHVLQVRSSPRKRGPMRLASARRDRGLARWRGPRDCAIAGRRRYGRPERRCRRAGRGGRDAAPHPDRRRARRHRHRPRPDRRAPGGVRAGHPRHRAGARRHRRWRVRRRRRRAYPRGQLRQDPRPDRRRAAERSVRAQRGLRLLAAKPGQHREDRDPPGPAELDLGLGRHRRGDLAHDPRGGRLARARRGRHARHLRRLCSPRESAPTPGRPASPSRASAPTASRRPTAFPSATPTPPGTSAATAG